MQTRSKSSFPWFGVLILGFVIVVGVLFFWQWQVNKTADEKNASVEQTLSLPDLQPTLPEIDEEAVEMAVGEEMGDGADALAEPAKPILPKLNDSDAVVKTKVSELDGGTRLLAFMVDDELIRKGVRAAHSLSEGWVVKEYRPVSSPNGKYIVTDTGKYDEQQQKIYQTASSNYERYKTHIDVLTNFPPEHAASLYRYFYPLMQQAYEELGLRKGEFHSVMLTALDNTVSAPVFPQDQSLRQPSVMYVYADKSVENLSSLEKLKLRIGAENLEELSAWVRKFRQEIGEF